MKQRFFIKELLLKHQSRETGEEALLLRVLLNIDVLLEDPSYVPGTYVQVLWLTAACNTSFRDLMPSYGVCRHPSGEKKAQNTQQTHLVYERRRVLVKTVCRERELNMVHQILKAASPMHTEG